MTDVRALIAKLAEEEKEFIGTSILAPCIAGSRVRTMVGGIPYTLTPVQEKFEGWGIFRAIDHHQAELIDEADLPTIDAYLSLFPKVRLRLAVHLQGGTWLAYPMDEDEAGGHRGNAGPVQIHLVAAGGRFDAIVARYDGAGYWYDDLDRRADPAIADELRVAAGNGLPADALRIRGLTPEDRIAYGIVCGAAHGRNDQERLRRALRVGGGVLRGYRDQGEFWLVEWQTPDGEQHSSTIRKRDLTVISAGICLSGQDRTFDLQSLVGVIRDRPGWMRQ